MVADLAIPSYLGNSLRRFSVFPKRLSKARDSALEPFTNFPSFTGRGV